MFVIAGPGGAGKDTVVARVLAEDPSLELSRSWTTRPQRPGEPDDAYTFVDRATFEQARAEGTFLESADYLGQLYGTPKPSPGADADLILVIEVQGAARVLADVAGAVMILLVPPSREVQHQRLRQRGDPPDAIARRLAFAAEEERVGRAMAHHVVINDDLGRAASEVAGILASYRKMPRGA